LHPRIPSTTKSVWGAEGEKKKEPANGPYLTQRKMHE